MMEKETRVAVIGSTTIYQVRRIIRRQDNVIVQPLAGAVPFMHEAKFPI